MKQLYALLLFLAVGQAVAQPNQAPFSVFLLGDAGEPVPNGKDPVLNALQTQLRQAPRQSALIYLGDNLYPSGLPDADDLARPEAERRLTDQLDLMKTFAGRAFMIPGNHDWQQGRRQGWQRIKNQQTFVDTYTGRADVFYPKEGCPTPQEITLSDDLTLILLDTQWWLHPWEKPEQSGTTADDGADPSDCEVKTLEDMLTMVDEILDRNRSKRVIVAGHHPLYSHGEHGGHYTFTDHLFPLHERGVWIPLPVIGSIYPLYRSLIGNIQDIPNARYRQQRDGLMALLRQYPNVVYVNGHDHTLQHIVHDSLHCITSGSGSKNTPVGSKRDTRFAASKRGFARLDFFADTTRLVMYEGDNQAGRELYRTQFVLRPMPGNRSDSLVDALGRQAVIPNPRYRVGSFRQWLLGRNYRDSWTQPVVVPRLDFRQTAGGLRVTQRGGGQQTLSLRYLGKDGHEYVTRSIEKYPERAVPEALRSRFTIDLVTDQISAAHPFGALAVPPLAEAAGVLHTNPKIVVIPPDTTLGRHKKLFANQLVLFEERPDDGFAGAKKTYSTAKMVDKLVDDNRNRVDESALLRARLFDMWIGDWDRHDDQWRWAAYANDTTKGLTFKPIPRDRDQAFFVNQGVLPKIISRKWLLPKFQGFDAKIRDVAGLNFNARFVDRSFLTQASLTDWLATARDLQTRLTDAVIDSAVARFPDQTDHPADIARKLRQRRADLPQYATQLYNFLSRNVDVVGSNKAELFTVTRQPDGQTDVAVHDQTKSGDAGRLLYQRRFDPAVTREIRLWGLDGDDRFVVSGQSPRGSLVRLIGGKDKDSFVDSSSVGRRGKQTVIYDKVKNTTLALGPESRNLTTDRDPHVNDYSRMAFKYDRLAPVGAFAANPDDGLFLGAGLLWTKQGFRKEPFATQHRLSGSYAFATGAFNLDYRGEFTDVIGKADIDLRAFLREGSLMGNFFGLGNETTFNKELGINYYRYELENRQVSLLVKNRFGKATLFYGPLFAQWEATERPGKYLAEFAPVGSPVYDSKIYAGLQAGFLVDTRNSPTLTTQGIYWETNATYQRGLAKAADRKYINLQTELAFYYSLRLPAIVTLTTRFGGGINAGDYEFYQANTLGGLSNLRGFRRTRFAGKNSFYNNTEIRVKLLTVKTYLFPAYAGVLAFNDVGRVWNPGERSSKWHNGVGGGIWLSPFNIAVISATCGFSEDGPLVSARLGFFF